MNSPNQEVILSTTEVEPALPVVSKPLVRRTFSIDGLNGGGVDVCETPDFQTIKLCVRNESNCSIEIQLNSERFNELSYLRYVVNLGKGKSSPF